MPEPLSITTGVLALLQVAWKVSTELKKFHNQVSIVDKSLADLTTDVDSLARVLESMRDTFAKITAEHGTGHVASHWSNVARSISDGKDILERLQVEVQKIGKTTKFMDGTRKQLRLNFAEDSITRFRIQIQSYRDGMQISLQTIILWNQVSYQKMADQVLPNLSELHDDVRRLAMGLNHRIESLQALVQQQQTEQLPGPSDGQASEAMKDNVAEVVAMSNLRDCVQSAASIVSSASTVIASQRGGDARTVVPSSDFGDVFPTRGVAIQRWMESRTVYEYDETALQAPPQSVADVPAFGASDQSSDESDLEQEIVEVLFTNAKQKLATGDQKAAERMFKNCLSRMSTNELRQGTKQIAKYLDIVDHLYQIYHRQSKWPEAQRLLNQRMAVKERILGKKDADFLGDIMTLSRLMQSMGDLIAAHLHARRALKGFKKLNKKEDTKACLLLLIELCDANDNEDDREAYAIMLSGFSTPKKGVSPVVRPIQKDDIPDLSALRVHDPTLDTDFADSSTMEGAERECEGDLLTSQAAVADESPTSSPSRDAISDDPKIDDSLDFASSAQVPMPLSAPPSPSGNIESCDTLRPGQVDDDSSTSSVHDATEPIVRQDEQDQVDSTRQSLTRQSLPKVMDPAEENVESTQADTAPSLVHNRTISTLSSESLDGSEADTNITIPSLGSLLDTEVQNLPSTRALGTSSASGSGPAANVESFEDGVRRNASGGIINNVRRDQHVKQAFSFESLSKKNINPPKMHTTLIDKAFVQRFVPGALHETWEEPWLLAANPFDQEWAEVILAAADETFGSRETVKSLRNTIHCWDIYGLPVNRKLRIEALHMTFQLSKAFRANFEWHVARNTAKESGLASALKGFSRIPSDLADIFDTELGDWRQLVRGMQGDQSSTAPTLTISPPEPNSSKLTSANRTLPRRLDASNLAKVSQATHERPMISANASVMSVAGTEPEAESPVSTAYVSTAEYRRKLVIVGDGGVGKTALLVVFSKGTFPEGWAPTAAVENYVADVEFDEKHVELALWDTAGVEGYDRLRPLSYRDSHVILICFSIDWPDSLDNVLEKWIPEVLRFCAGLQYILVGLKKDLRDSVRCLEDLNRFGQHPVTPAEGEAARRKIGAVAYMETSAKTSEGVRELFETVCWLALMKIVKGDPKMKSKRKNFLNMF